MEYLLTTEKTDAALALPPALASQSMRLRHLLINVLAFALTYPLANEIAQRAAVQRSVALPIDGLVPFVPWLIVPYLTSGLFFVACFFLVRSRDDVRVLSQRLLLATIVAALIFAVVPARFSLPRPAIDQALLATLFDLLALVDRPYNQLPSLHVAYCLIFWYALRDTVARTSVRTAIGAWLGLVAAATVFTYQHHVLDVAGGLALGIMTVVLIRPGKAEPDVAFHYLLGAVLALTVGGLLLRQWFAIYLSASLALVGLAYLRGDRFFLKKARGRFPLHVWLIYGPYLLGYRLTWQLVRLRERGHAPFAQAAAGLWVGRRLGSDEAQQLPAGCTVIDLANELSETPALRACRYLHFPLLDLREPPADAVADILGAMATETRAGRPIYLHCAMGFSRSRAIARRFLDTLPS